MTLIDKAEALAAIEKALNNATGDMYDAYAAIVALPARGVGEAADHWRKIARDRYTAIAAERAKVAKLVEKLTALEKAASEVARRGAETGPQWTKLTITLLAARAAITEAGQ